MLFMGKDQPDKSPSGSPTRTLQITLFARHWSWGLFGTRLFLIIHHQFPRGEEQVQLLDQISRALRMVAMTVPQEEEMLLLRTRTGISRQLTLTCLDFVHLRDESGDEGDK